MGTTTTSTAYPGIGGHTYYFRCRARDHAGQSVQRRRLGRPKNRLEKLITHLMQPIFDLAGTLQ
jgi:hypothetical protein